MDDLSTVERLVIVLSRWLTENIQGGFEGRIVAAGKSFGIAITVVGAFLGFVPHPRMGL